MEKLICSAFDKLATFDDVTVRKGLRQVELMLANLCLKGSQEGLTKPPEDDAALLQFCRLQDSFEYNGIAAEALSSFIAVCLRILSTLNRLVAQGHDPGNSQLILTAVFVLQGLLLIHGPSRRLFRREAHMALLLELIEPHMDEEVQATCLHTIVCSLVDEWDNLRTFEDLGGIESITSLFKRKDTPHSVKLKILEFLYFYLIPEPESSGQDGLDDTAGTVKYVLAPPRKRTEDKVAVLSKYLSNVDDLVRDLDEFRPFGDVC